MLSEGGLSRIKNIQKAVVVAVLIVNINNSVVVRRYDMVVADEQKYGVVRWQVDAFAYDAEELSEGDIFENEILMFIDVGTRGIEVIFFADDGYFVVMRDHDGIRVVQSL